MNEQANIPNPATPIPSASAPQPASAAAEKRANARKGFLGCLGLIVGIIVVVGIIGAICSPKDETPLPSPNASLAELHLARREAHRPLATTQKFPGRVFLVMEGDKMKSGIGWFYTRKHVSATLQGARTIAFVKLYKSVIGFWTGSNKPDYHTSFDVCIIEIGNTTHRIRVGAEAQPRRTVVTPRAVLGIWSEEREERAYTKFDSGEQTGFMSDGSVVEKILSKYLQE